MKFLFKRKYKKVDAYTLTGTIILSALMSACGGSAYRTQPNTAATAGSSGTSTGSGTTSKSTGTTSTTTTTGIDTNLLPSISQDFSTYGTASSQVSGIQTDNHLRVQVTAQAAGAGQGSGFTANYNCISYQVSLKNSSGTVLKSETVTLAVQGPTQYCPSATQSKVIDFSSYMTSGHSAMTLEVKGLTYDWLISYCGTYPWYCNGYVPTSLTAINGQHNVKGNLSIETNGTAL